MDKQNKQDQRDKIMSEVFKNLSPEAQEKMLCIAEGMRLAERNIPEPRPA